MLKIVKICVVNIQENKHKRIAEIPRVLRITKKKQYEEVYKKYKIKFYN
jgi:hypothetical protein